MTKPTLPVVVSMLEGDFDTVLAQADAVIVRESDDSFSFDSPDCVRVTADGKVAAVRIRPRRFPPVTGVVVSIRTPFNVTAGGTLRLDGTYGGRYLDHLFGQ